VGLSVCADWAWLTGSAREVLTVTGEPGLRNVMVSDYISCAMAPYPAHLVTDIALRDGTVVHLRPVREDDEPRLQDLFAHMTAEDIRLRFFAAMRELGHALGFQLSHIDYHRRMAIMAEHDGDTLGIGRYAAEDDERRAEFAVAVRSDWHGRGVGYLLLTQLVVIARDAGFAELYGLVLHENQLMLDMCRELCFSVAAHHGDPSLTIVRKSLMP
jgi:acetyltransferase